MDRVRCHNPENHTSHPWHLSDSVAAARLGFSLNVYCPGEPPRVVVNHLPTPEQIIAHLESGGSVERLESGLGWVRSHSDAEQWRLKRISWASAYMYRLVAPEADA